MECIKQTAEDNGGIPLGKERFFQETGIKYEEWFPTYWLRWSDALREAGFTPRTLQQAYGEDALIEKYIDLVRELGHVPIRGELLRKRQRDPSFPNSKTFERMGTKDELIGKVLEYCRDRDGFDDVIQFCAAVPSKSSKTARLDKERAEDGFVYLLKVGRYYKIGKTNAVGRREYELTVQSPTKPRTVHVIRTDDPTGIEAYWHGRFAAKRMHREFFALDSSDVYAFKRRRKFM